MRPAYWEAVKKRMRFWARPCHGMWLFYIYNMLKIQVLSKFLLRDSMIEALLGDSFGVSRNKASTASYDTAFGKGSAIATD